MVTDEDSELDIDLEPDGKFTVSLQNVLQFLKMFAAFISTFISLQICCSLKVAYHWKNLASELSKINIGLFVGVAVFGLWMDPKKFSCRFVTDGFEEE